MAVALCRRRRAGVVHAMDSTQRTGTRNLEDAWSEIARRKPVQSDFWATPDWPNVADHSARHGGAIRVLGNLLLAASIPRSPAIPGWRRNGSRGIARVDYSR